MAYVEVPERGRKWVAGTLLYDADRRTLYRVAPGRTISYSADCLPIQKVSKVRKIPDDFRAAIKLQDIIAEVKRTGTHTPTSRGADGTRPIGAIPLTDGPTAEWTCAAVTITAIGDVVVVHSRYGDGDNATVWVADGELADEVHHLIRGRPNLYTRAHIVGV